MINTSQSKKIIFVSYGDSTAASSWSNIPYLFSKNLEKHGFDLVRLNILPEPERNLWWNKNVSRYLSIFFPNHQYSYIRSWFFRRETFSKIKQVIARNQDAYFCIFLNFEFYNRYNDIPSMLFGDWSYDMIILDRLKRKPYFFEKWFIKYQREALKKAQIKISLFEDTKDILSKRYKIDVKHLGINVINDLNINHISSEEILQAKINSHHILFIGTVKYIEGAKKLLAAFTILSKKYPKLHLNFIGIDKKDIGEWVGIAENVSFFGYLKKEVEEDNKLYYNLLHSAKVLVNPSEGWAAYSSSVEAMNYYTPVIIKPYNAFKKDFGSNCDFGYYLENTKIETIANAIENTIFSENYFSYCKRAKEMVKSFTWEKYIELLIREMQKVKRASCN